MATYSPNTTRDISKARHGPFNPISCHVPDGLKKKKKNSKNKLASSPSHSSLAGSPLRTPPTPPISGRPTGDRIRLAAARKPVDPRRRRWEASRAPPRGRQEASRAPPLAPHLRRPLQFLLHSKCGGKPSSFASLVLTHSALPPESYLYAFIPSRNVRSIRRAEEASPVR